MLRQALADADTPFATRAITGFRYPLRGGAMLTIVAVTLLESLSFLPVTGLKLLVILLGWLGIYVYAFGCLRHTADGFADPPELAMREAVEPDDDSALLAHAEQIAHDDLPAAIDILTERLREGLAPAAMHTRYRQWLRAQERLPELLVHGQIWIAALVAQREPRRALGVAQDCIDLDQTFLPDAPETCGPLADTAANGGMTRLAMHLASGYLSHWPGDMGAPHYGLLAVRMHERLGDAEAAAVLARELLATYPDHPVGIDLSAMLGRLDGSHGVIS